MSDTCATVKIIADNEDGHAVINESDFDEAVHTKFEPVAASGGLADLTVVALKARAETHGVDLGDAVKKAEIIAALDAAGVEKPE